MSSFLKNIQSALRRETVHVGIYTLLGLVVMWIVFWILHILMPERVPFDYTVILGGVGGGIVAVLNFFWMGLTIQNAALMSDQDNARGRIRASYSRRMLLQMLWGIVAAALPYVQFAAALLPLLFPSLGIKISGIFMKKR